MRRQIIYTHTGIISTKEGSEQVKLYERPNSWVATRNRVYYKSNGLRCGGIGPRLNLSSIHEIGSRDE